MVRTGRSWLLAVPLALVLGLAVLPLAKGSVDTSLAGTARAALDEAGVRDVTVVSEWAALRLSGPAPSRDAALAAVARMDHRDAVSTVAYVVPAAAAAQAPAPSPSPTATTIETLPPVDLVAGLRITGVGAARTVTLSGTLADERQHAAFLAAVRGWGPATRVVDTVTVTQGDTSDAALAAWPEFLRVAGPVSVGLSAPGEVRLGPDGIVVSGPAGTERAAAVVTRRAADAAARGIVVRNTVLGPVGATRQRLAAVPGLANLQFTHGSEVLTPASQKSLDAAVRVLRSLPPGVTVEIRGFTDDKGDPQLNLRLSQRRAAAVLQYLLGRRAPADRLRARGLGEASPKASNRTDAGRAANRRIEFLVKGS